MEKSSKKSIIFKILHLGDTGIGKSDLQRRYFGESFADNRINSIGADFAVRKMSFNKIQYFLRIWNLSNEEKFEAIRRTYFNNTKGVIITFDILNTESFFNIPLYLEEIWKNVGLCPLVILGNNSYMRKYYAENVVVSLEDALEFSKRLSRDVRFLVPYYETSIDTGENIDDLFSYLGLELLKIHESALLEES